MFQCFIGFPICVIISQCLLTFHNFNGGLAATFPANNYDRVVLHHYGGMTIPWLAEKKLTQPLGNHCIFLIRLLQVCVVFPSNLGEAPGDARQLASFTTTCD